MFGWLTPRVDDGRLSTKSEISKMGNEESGMRDGGRIDDLRLIAWTKRANG